MKPPSHSDRLVKVTAYLTDEAFGYDHWRAAQFSAPYAKTTQPRPALLIICKTDAEREQLGKALVAALESFEP